MEADESGDGDGDGDCAVTPGEWAAPDFATNAADALALRAALDGLNSDVMRAAEEGTITLGGIDDLTGPWQAGDPSLAAHAHAAWDPVIQDAFAELVALVAAGEVDLIDDQSMWAPGADGGIFGESRRGLNEGGLEVRQIVEKGSYSGGVMYQYALGLTEGEIDAATIDALAAAWGANAELDPAGELTDAANYSHSMGFHGAIAAALTNAKAYAEDEACAAQRDAALSEFFATWELAMMARAVYYGNETIVAVLESGSDSDLAEALHELSEGIGLAIGFHGAPDPTAGPLAGAGRTISDDQLAAILSALGVDASDLGASTTGEFVESLTDLEDAVGAVEDTVKEAYGLTDGDIAAFRSPTPG